MSARRFLAILGAAIAAIAFAMSLDRLRQKEPDVAGVPLLPQLGQQLGTIERVTIRRGSMQPGVTLHRRGERWVVLERADYPADTARLRKLLQAIAAARVIEEKTADPSSYAALGVDDPQRSGALGTEVAIAAPSGTRVLIVGKPAMGGNFVRLGGVARSLLAAPGITVDAEPRDWIETRILALKPADVRDALVKPASAAATPLPSAHFATLASLAALDVAPAAGIDFRTATVTSVTLADGSMLTLRGAVAGDKRWLTVASTTDAALNERVRDVAFQVAASSFDAIFRP